MIVGASRHQAEALLGQGLGERRSIAHDLLGVALKGRIGGFAEGHGLAGNGMFEGPTLQTGEDRLVDRRGVLGLGEDATTTRTTKGLVGGERDDVGVRNRVRMHPAGDEPGDMGGIEHEQRANLVGDGPDGFGIDDARVCSCPGDDHLGALTQRRLADLVVVDPLIGGRDAIGHEVVEETRDVDR